MTTLLISDLILFGKDSNAIVSFSGTFSVKYPSLPSGKFTITINSAFFLLLTIEANLTIMGVGGTGFPGSYDKIYNDKLSFLDIIFAVSKSRIGSSKG